MNDEKQMGDVNRQDLPHQEGQQNNAAPITGGQPNAGNHQQQMSNMEGPERQSGQGSPGQAQSRGSDAEGA